MKTVVELAVMVTGGVGQLGFHARSALQSAGYRLGACDRLVDCEQQAVKLDVLKGAREDIKMEALLEIANETADREFASGFNEAGFEIRQTGRLPRAGWSEPGGAATSDGLHLLDVSHVQHWVAEEPLREIPGGAI